MDYFDYSSQGYGMPEAPIGKYSFFLHTEATNVGGLFELELYFYYRLLDNELIEFMLGIPYNANQPTYSIVGRFRLKEPFHRQLLKHYIREFIMGGRNYLGLDYDFKKSTIMSERQFMEMMDDILADLRISQYQQEIKWSNAPIATLCRAHGLELVPVEGEDQIAECRCPAGHSHRLKLNLNSASWFCGYCGKNGHLEELKDHINRYMERGTGLKSHRYTPG